MYQHAKYQAGICHRSLVICPDIPRPDDDSGWIFDAQDKNLNVYLVPDAVLNLLSCSPTCKRICKLPVSMC